MHMLILLLKKLIEKRLPELDWAIDEIPVASIYSLQQTVIMSITWLRSHESALPAGLQNLPAAMRLARPDCNSRKAPRVPYVP